jgi:hypothetical protein
MKQLGKFSRIADVAQTHPFCRQCLGVMARRSFQRPARKEASTRTCAQCSQDLPVRMFHWLRASATFHSYCRPCHAAYMAERYRRLQEGRRK